MTDARSVKPDARCSRRRAAAAPPHALTALRALSSLSLCVSVCVCACVCVCVCVSGSLARAFTHAQDVDSAVEAEVQAQPQLRTIWDTHRWEGLYFLDAGVAMLTLGQQAIVRDELRGKLQPAAIATLYILLPRLLEGEAGSCTARSVIPPVNAIWQALSEMPGKHAASFADALNCAWRRRQSRLERVLVRPRSRAGVALQYFCSVPHVTENKFLHTLSLHTQTQSHLALASSPMSKL